LSWISVLEEHFLAGRQYHQVEEAEAHQVTLATAIEVDSWTFVLVEEGVAAQAYANLKWLFYGAQKGEVVA